MTCRLVDRPLLCSCLCTSIWFLPSFVFLFFRLPARTRRRGRTRLELASPRLSVTGATDWRRGGCSRRRPRWPRRRHDSFSGTAAAPCLLAQAGLHQLLLASVVSGVCVRVCCVCVNHDHNGGEFLSSPVHHDRTNRKRGSLSSIAVSCLLPRQAKYEHFSFYSYSIGWLRL